MTDKSQELSGLLRNEEGKLIKSIMNLVLCFQIDENLKNLFHYNEFSGYIEYRSDAIWHDIKKGKHLEDDDIVFIQYYLAHNKRFEMPTEKIRNAVTEISRRTIYNPVKEYLESLQWDGKERLDLWLIKGCGVDDNIYTREVGRKWLTASVARIYKPGIKFDHVLILEGKENIGKSTVLRTLGDPWFCDSIDLLQDEKDIVAKMRGNWIIELAEMQGITKKDVEWIKAFLACQVDEQRLAYRRDPQKYPRQSVFAGTSNKMAYLLDENGNRRFWPVDCTKIDIKWIKDNKNQLFAEAKHRYRENEKLFLEDEVFEMAKREQKRRLNVDEVLEEIIERYMVGKDEVTMQEILMDCLGHSVKDTGMRSQQSVAGRILTKMGFEKKNRKSTDGSRFKYIRQTVTTMARTSEEDLEIEKWDE